ncbi:MAG TPA: hypothetical protein VMN78_05580 [Longimicrobiales bacterium]|nr:hypothetical protein [Longimicrobiales bacterium]
MSRGYAARGGRGEAIGPLALFELRRGAQRPSSLLALLLLAGTLALSHVDEWRGRSAGEGFFGHAYLLGAIAFMRYGLAADRRLRFDEYLIVNHVRPATYLSAKVCAMAILLVAYGAVAVVLEAAFSGGGFADAAWLALAFTLAAWMFAPLVMLVETWADTSLPAAVVLLAYFVTVITIYMVGGTLAPLDVLGITHLEPGYWSSLGPLTLRSLIGAPLAFLLVGAAARLSLPRC